MSPFRLFVLTMAAFVTATAIAQTEASPDAMRASAERVLPCARRQQEDIDRSIRLLGEARDHLASRGTSDNVRRDAAHAVQVLEARLHDSAEALARCAEEPSHATPRPPEPVAPAAPTFESIGANVRMAEPVHVDGAGQLETSVARSAVHDIGGALDACYEALTERYAIVRGETHLVFRVSSARAASGVRFETLSMGDAAFRSCLERAARSLRVAAAPSGGDVTFSVLLRFGPE